MKKLIIALALLLSFTVPAFAGSHEIDNITIIYDSETDLKLAIEAINWINQFFQKQFNKHIRPVATIEFKDKVLVRFEVPENEHIKKIIEYQVYGLCHRDINLIQMTTWESKWLRERGMFLLPLSREIHKSVIIHELAHLYLNEITGENKKKLTHASHEFFAYTTQLISLSPETRNLILSLHPGEFDSVIQINIVFHNFAPHKYGVRCYKWYIKHGKKHLKMIINFEFIALDKIRY